MGSRAVKSRRHDFRTHPYE
ncbi:MAG: hypothetical protein GX117_11470 [Candidatus Hydrogenedentes bacterium]|nr:hypothetical protein [Candidatus Hydrogenedentota bacterium]